MSSPESDAGSCRGRAGVARGDCGGRGASQSRSEDSIDARSRSGSGRASAQSLQLRIHARPDFGGICDKAHLIPGGGATAFALAAVLSLAAVVAALAAALALAVIFALTRVLVRVRGKGRTPEAIEPQRKYLGPCGVGWRSVEI